MLLHAAEVTTMSLAQLENVITGEAGPLELGTSIVAVFGLSASAMLKAQAAKSVALLGWLRKCAPE